MEDCSNKMSSSCAMSIKVILLHGLFTGPLRWASSRGWGAWRPSRGTWCSAAWWTVTAPCPSSWCRPCCWPGAWWPFCSPRPSRRTSAETPSWIPPLSWARLLICRSTEDIYRFLWIKIIPVPCRTLTKYAFRIIGLIRSSGPIWFRTFRCGNLFFGGLRHISWREHVWTLRPWCTRLWCIHSRCPPETSTRCFCKRDSVSRHCLWSLLAHCDVLHTSQAFVWSESNVKKTVSYLNWYYML